MALSSTTTMANAMTVDEFTPFSVTCEIRYKNAYLLFDRTGQILKDLGEHFTAIEVTSASPAQTVFTSEECAFTIELGACRSTTSQIDSSGEFFAKQCRLFFGAVTENLGISVLSRIGLRYLARREYKTLDEAKVALASLGLLNLTPLSRFKSSDSPIEILLRWEDNEIGAFIRLKAETVNIKLTTSPELRTTVPNVDKNIVGLTLDIDYYTVAPVLLEQWEPLEWLQQKLRIVRKEADSIIQSRPQ